MGKSTAAPTTSRTTDRKRQRGSGSNSGETAATKRTAATTTTATATTTMTARAAVYHGDIGSEGIKPKISSWSSSRSTSRSTAAASSLLVTRRTGSSPHKVAAGEQKRRADRAVRFTVVSRTGGGIGGGGAVAAGAVAASALPPAAAGARRALLPAPRWTPPETAEAPWRRKRRRLNSTGSWEEKFPAANLPSSIPSAAAAEGGPLVGTNQSLEKPYLRLTTYPRSSDVRPLPVLIRALAHIKRRYAQSSSPDGGDDADVTYDWCHDQLQSLRQDLTVQRLHHHRFVVDVYETHGRMLLEHGDLPAFNQCQCNLQQLTTATAPPPTTTTAPHGPGGDNNDMGGDGPPLAQSVESAAEFRAYAVLYALVRHARTDLHLLRLRRLRQQQQQQQGQLQTALTSANRKSKKHWRRRSPSSAQTAPRNSPSVQPVAVSGCEVHAWRVVQAVTDGGSSGGGYGGGPCSYATFFRLYETAPHLSAYLMDFLVRRVRSTAIAAIVAAYRPSVSVTFVRDALRFADEDDTRRFLVQQHAVFMPDETPPLWIDCRQSQLQQQRRRQL